MGELGLDKAVCICAWLFLLSNTFPPFWDASKAHVARWQMWDPALPKSRGSGVWPSLCQTVSTLGFNTCKVAVAKKISSSRHWHRLFEATHGNHCLLSMCVLSSLPSQGFLSNLRPKICMTMPMGLLFSFSNIKMYWVSFFKPKIVRSPLTMIPLSKRSVTPSQEGLCSCLFPLASVLNKQERMSSCKAETEPSRGASKGLRFQ